MSKIAIFADYTPCEKVGGPVRQIVNLVEALGSAYEMFIISRDHDFGEASRFGSIRDGWNTVGSAKVLYLPDKEINVGRYGEILDEVSPDMVYTLSVFSVGLIFPCIIAARRRGIPILIAPCGQTCAGSLQFKRWKKILYLKIAKAFRIFKGIYFFTTSKKEYDSMVKLLGIPENRLFLMPNIPQEEG